KSEDPTNKEELFISEHPKSYLELVSTDWRPMIEIEFPKPRGKEAKENESVDIENFIAIKGIKALGNQLITEKVKNINSLEPLPYEPVIPEKTEDIEVVDEQAVESGTKNKKSKDVDGGSADEPTLFD
ncbi:MAG: DNA gyrase/topoisomerase IV subunit A, partial [Maribacter dokdonensis]